MPVFPIGGSRQGVIQQTSRHEDSRGHHNTTRVSVSLQARDCRDINWFCMSSAHRVLTVTLCNESKRNLRALLEPAAAEAAQEERRAPPKPLLIWRDSLLTSAGDRRFALDIGYLGGGRKDTDHLPAGSSPSSWLFGPAPRLDSADLG